MATNNAINANQSGIQSYDGAGTWSGRTLQSSTPNLTITNPDGIAGNPSFAISGFTMWTDVTGTTQTMSVANGYIADNASLVTFTLPSTAAIGDMIQVLGKGAGGWKIAQNASQQINVGKLASTAGTGGSIASINQFDTVELRCITAGASTVWTAKVTGNITVV
jgi:hypothetical protein